MPRYLVHFTCQQDGQPDTGTIPVDTGDKVIESVAQATAGGLGRAIRRNAANQGHDISGVQITAIEKVEALP